MFRTPATFGPPRMSGPPRMFGGRGAAAPAGVESEWCVVLDGVNDSVHWAGASSRGNTWCAWIFDTRGSGWRTIFAQDNSHGLWINMFNKLQAYPVAQSTATVSANAWHHIAVVVSASGDVTYYLDGVEAGTGTGVAAATWNKIGRSTAASEQFGGRIDDVRIYNRAIDATEVAAIAANTSDITTGLTAYLPLETGTGTTTPVLDSTGATIATATLVGGVTWSSDVPPALAP